MMKTNPKKNKIIIINKIVVIVIILKLKMIAKN